MKKKKTFDYKGFSKSYLIERSIYYENLQTGASP